MNERIAARIARNFEAVRPSTGRGTAWRWAEGVHVFPEAVCPFCWKPMQSPYIWVIDERAKRLEAVFKLVSNRKRLRLENTGRLHPHVDDEGYVCMSDGTARRADSVASALFLDMNPYSTMRGFGSDPQHHKWSDWLATHFNHRHDETVTKAKRRRKLLTGNAPKVPAVKKRVRKSAAA